MCLFLLRKPTMTWPLGTGKDTDKEAHIVHAVIPCLRRHGNFLTVPSSREAGPTPRGRVHQAAQVVTLLSMLSGRVDLLARRAHRAVDGEADVTPGSDVQVVHNHRRVDPAGLVDANAAGSNVGHGKCPLAALPPHLQRAEINHRVLIKAAVAVEVDNFGFQAKRACIATGQLALSEDHWIVGSFV